MNGRVSDYFIKSSQNKRDYFGSTNDLFNFEETKASNHLKDTLEKLTVERDQVKDDRDKLLQLLDDQDDCNYRLLQEEIILGEQVGWGAYSAVFKGDFYGKEIAIKKFNKTDERSLRIYANEVRILKTCHHPGIIQLIGYYETIDSFNIVTEFFP